jgi:hypothetical protein
MWARLECWRAFRAADRYSLGLKALAKALLNRWRPRDDQ